MPTETTQTNAASMTFDPSFKFPSLAEAMAAFGDARRTLDQKQALYGVAAAENAEKLRALDAATRAREEADMQYALAQVARRRIDALHEEQSRAISRRDSAFQQLARRAVEDTEVHAELSQLRRAFRAAEAEVQRLTTERDDEIKRVCLMSGMTEAEIVQENPWGYSVLGEALSRIGAQRSQAARWVGAAKAEQQAANEALHAATAAGIAAGDVLRARSKQLAAAALDEQIPELAANSTEKD